MKNQDFIIPLSGLKDKVYHFEYELEASFFDAAEQPLVRKPEIEVTLQLDKSKEPYVLDFDISGTYEDECDRCGSLIRVPVEGHFRLYVEFGEPMEEVDETEVIYIARDAHDLDLYEHIYDFVHLSLPMVKRCSTPEEKRRCDEKTKAFLSNSDDLPPEGDPRWEALKKLKNQ